MKTTGLENKSCRPHNYRISKIISPQLVSHILKIRQVEPMYGKEKIKRELEKDGVFVSVSTVGRILTRLIKQDKIQNIKLLKKKNSDKARTRKTQTLCRKNKKTKTGETRRTSTNRSHGIEFV